jgi:hypothetical protein
LGWKRKYSSLEQQTAEMRELYSFLRNKPLHESYEVFIYIRSSDDPAEALRRAKAADVLYMAPVNASGELEPGIRKLDLEALSASLIKVPAKPWTAVAGNGIVSELVSHFFAYDNSYFNPLVHRDSFLGDMREQDLEKAKFCSPLLVNIICAQQSVSSLCFLAVKGRISDRSHSFGLRERR